MPLCIPGKKLLHCCLISGCSCTEQIGGQEPAAGGVRMLPGRVVPLLSCSVLTRLRVLVPGAEQVGGQEPAAGGACVQLDHIPILALQHLQGLRVPLLPAEPLQAALRRGVLRQVCMQASAWPLPRALAPCQESRLRTQMLLLAGCTSCNMCDNGGGSHCSHFTPW